MISDAKRLAQKRRRDQADQRGDCTKCCRRKKLFGYQLCHECRERSESRRLDNRLHSTEVAQEQKGIDPRVNKQVRQLCYSLSACGKFDDGIPEQGEYHEQPGSWYLERDDMAADSISPFNE